MIHYTHTDSSDENFRTLTAQLDKELAERDGEEHAFYAQYNSIDNIADVVVACEDDLAAACGAFKKFDIDSVEIKRMYTHPTFRGRKIATGVLTELENKAKSRGYRFCVLETGKKQHEAIDLYKKSGYEITENYGQYAGVENSVCMKKILK